jgi:hypothetical protein
MWWSSSVVEKGVAAVSFAPVVLHGALRLECCSSSGRQMRATSSGGVLLAFVGVKEKPSRAELVIRMEFLQTHPRMRMRR